MSVSVQDFEACMECIVEDISSNVENINCGGCAFFAVELLKRMKAIGLDDAQIRVFGDWPEHDLVEVEQKLVACNGGPTDSVYIWNDNGVSFAHVMVEWNGRMFDAEGVIPVDHADEWRGWGLYAGTISLESMEPLANSERGWNRTYERWQDEIVQGILDEGFALLQ